MGYGLVNLTSPEAEGRVETKGVALNHTLIDGLIISIHIVSIDRWDLCMINPSMND